MLLVYIHSLYILLLSKSSFIMSRRLVAACPGQKKPQILGREGGDYKQ